jgi:hypothetical protein
MKQAEAHLKGISPYSCSKYHQTEKLPKELHDDYEKRTWRERCNYNKDGYIFIPPMAFKKCIATAATFLKEKIPGEGKATWTKHLNSGILVLEGLTLPIKKDDVEGEWFHVPSDGRIGGSSRVSKCFPVVRDWEGHVTFEIIDDKITEDVFRRHLVEAGKFIGVGRFRPERGGFNGRFAVIDLAWVE